MEQKEPKNRAGKTTPKSAKPSSGKPVGAKPVGAKPANAKPGDGLFGWFGRQVGHVKKAVKTDVIKQGKSAKPKPRSSPTGKAANPSASKPAPSADSVSGSEQVIFRQDKIEEAEVPHQPGVILRRTIIDEVVVERTVVEPATRESDDEQQKIG